MKNFSKFTVIIVFLFTTFLTLTFQNCSQSLNPSNTITDSSQSDYPYDLDTKEATNLTLGLFKPNLDKFNEACYLARYPEIAKAVMRNPGYTGLEHWQEHGNSEGRIPGCDIPASATFITSWGNSAIKLAVNTGRLAGAVSSILWNGVEFINVYDHGRELQTAFQIDDFHECNNPTEAGTESDGTGSTSTSKLISVNKIAYNILATKSKMAYWTYGKTTGACSNGADSRVATPLSNHKIEKTIQVGYDRDPNIIKYNIQISLAPNSFSKNVIFEFLTGYLNSQFTKFQYVSLTDRRLHRYESIVDISGNGFPRGSFAPRSTLKKLYDPLIISTEDDRYAMGVYVPQSNVGTCSSLFHGYSAYKFLLGGSGPYGNTTNKWGVALQDSANSNCLSTNSRSFEVYLVVDTVANVHQKLLTLSRNHP